MPHLCPYCNGSGQDKAKTEKANKGVCKEYRESVRCWNCHGNGLDPAAYFRWSGPREPSKENNDGSKEGPKAGPATRTRAA